MGAHQLERMLSQGILKGSGRGCFVAGKGYLTAWGPTVPSGQSGYAVGGYFLKTGGSGGDDSLFVNIGTKASCTFTSLASVAAADFGAGGAKMDALTESTASAGITIPTGVQLALVTADKLLVGGVIVPQQVIVSGIIMPHASLTTRDLFYANRAYTVTAITVTPLLVQGGALTGTLCKAAGTTAPAGATTPLHSGTANFNATAYTPQALTLTATAADLALAATNRIGIEFSAALSTGVAAYTIELKRS